MKFDVASIGILVADVIASTVDRLPDRGKLSAVDTIRMYSGGNAMNAAIDLRKLGATSAVLGKVGADGFGVFLRGELEKAGVDTRGISMDPSAVTSSSLVLVDRGGERTFLHCSQSNDRFSFEDVDFSVIEESKLVFFTGVYLMRTMDEGDMIKLLKRCRELGKPTVVDTCWDAHGRWMSVMRPAFEYIDYFIPSYDEAVMIAGETNVDKIADLFFEMGVKHLVIKLGSDGCYVRPTAADKGIIIPSYKVENPVDTTGAGDSFCSGFLYGLSHDMPLTECARIGNAVGAHCVMAVGASTGIKPYGEIRKFIEERQEK